MQSRLKDAPPSRRSSAFARAIALGGMPALQNMLNAKAIFAK